MLGALRVYQAADAAMRRRTRDAMSMTENELSGLRYLIRAANTQRTVTPSDVARYLGISTAATTALLDRLERNGYVLRRPHPSDRRKLHVLATVHADEEVRATLGDMHERMMDAARGFHPAESAAITEFLRRVTDAVEGIAEDAPAEIDARGPDRAPAQAG